MPTTTDATGIIPKDFLDALDLGADAGVDKAITKFREVDSIALGKATRDTGWEPRIAWTDTLAAVLENWRARVAAEG